MAKKKNNTAKAVAFSLVALVLGIVVGGGGNFGYTTATYTEETNTVNNEKKISVATASEGTVYNELRINFLELGNKYAGDCTYIKAGDTDILIDGGSRADSADDIKRYVDQYCTDGKIEYMIATHAHQDHIAALVGNSNKNYGGGRDGLMNMYKVGTLIDFANTNNTSGNLYKNYKANRDYLASEGTICLTGKECLDENKDTFTLAEGITLKILYNKYYYELSSDENNHSVCAMITYGEHNYLFTGDLEKEGEEAFAAYYDKSTPEKTLPSQFDLYKGGHHGSKTSSNDCLLDLIDPQMCCVCCCAGSTEYTVNRVNTFPTQAFINRIAKHTDAVYITSMWNEETETFESMNGNITVSSDGTNVGLAASNNLTKLKDTAWFSHKVLVNEKDQIVAKGTSGAKEVSCRELPEEWK